MTTPTKHAPKPGPAKDAPAKAPAKTPGRKPGQSNRPPVDLSSVAVETAAASTFTRSALLDETPQFRQWANQSWNVEKRIVRVSAGKTVEYGAALEIVIPEAAWDQVEYGIRKAAEELGCGVRFDKKNRKSNGEAVPAGRAVMAFQVKTRRIHKPRSTGQPEAPANGAQPQV